MNYEHYPFNEKNRAKLFNTEDNRDEIYRDYLMYRNTANLYTVGYPNQDGKRDTRTPPHKLSGLWTSKELARDAIDAEYQRQEEIDKIVRQYVEEKITKDEASRLLSQQWGLSAKLIQEKLTGLR